MERTSLVSQIQHMGFNYSNYDHSHH